MAFLHLAYSVYILYSASLDKFYVGCTENIELRLQYHNDPIEKRKFTAKGIPWKLMKTIPCTDKPEALKLERHIKAMKSRKYIQDILSGKIEPHGWST